MLIFTTTRVFTTFFYRISILSCLLFKRIFAINAYSKDNKYRYYNIANIWQLSLLALAIIPFFSSTFFLLISRLKIIIIIIIIFKALSNILTRGCTYRHLLTALQANLVKEWQLEKTKAKVQLLEEVEEGSIPFYFYYTVFVNLHEAIPAHLCK